MQTKQAKRLLIPVVAGAAAFILSTASAFAGNAAAEASSSGRYQVVVAYSDLNLDQSAGIERLHKRLSAAAKLVCASRDGRSLKESMDYRACYDQALGDAVAKVNRAAVTAFHQKVSKQIAAS